MEIYNDANMYGVKSSNSIAVSNSSLAIEWLEATFPDLTEQGTRGDNILVVKAHPYALLDASLALQVWIPHRLGLLRETLSCFTNVLDLWFISQWSSSNIYILLNLIQNTDRTKKMTPIHMFFLCLLLALEC